MLQCVNLWAQQINLTYHNFEIGNSNELLERVPNLWHPFDDIHSIIMMVHEIKLFLNRKYVFFGPGKTDFFGSSTFYKYDG